MLRGLLGGSAALLFGLFFLLSTQLVQASMITIIGEPAEARANEIPTTLTAEALVTANLLTHNEASVAFDTPSITLGEGVATNLTLTVTNTGINNLDSGSVRLVFPAGVTAVFPPNPLYTAVEQPDGSWIITFANTLLPGIAIGIDMLLTVEPGTPAGAAQIDAEFTANGVSIRDAMAAVILGNTTAGLYLTHAVDKTIVSADEAIRYTLTVTNQMASNVTNVLLVDALPFGVRFLSGTATVNGLPVADPALSADGRTLTFPLGTIAPDATVTISFLGFVTSTTPPGDLNSIAAAAGDNATSNRAVASVRMQRDAMNIDSHIVGRVLADACEATTKPTGELNLYLYSQLDGGEVVFTLVADVDNGGANMDNFAFHVNLPAALSYIPGATMLDDQLFVPEVAGRTLTFRLGGAAGRWKKTITFRALPDLQQPGKYEVTANAVYEIATYGRYQSQPLRTSYQSFEQLREYRTFTYTPDYRTLDKGLPEIRRDRLADLARAIEGRTVTAVTVTGYTDAVSKAELARSVWRSDVAFSEALARSVGEGLSSLFSIDSNRIQVVGKGAVQPPKNKKLKAKEGQKNRRVEVKVEMTPPGVDPDRQQVEVGEGSSARSSVYARRVQLDPQVTAETKGIPGVRLVMEDGRFVDTDATGSYHFEGLKPGSHVVQIDPASIPEGYEIYRCINNSRFANTPTSQFVDITEGLIWRADFHLRSVVNVVTATSGVQLSSSVTTSEEGDKTVHYRILASGSSLPQGRGSLLVQLPEGVEINASTVKRNGEPVEAVKRDEFWQIPLASLEGEWRQEVVFDAPVRTEEVRGYTTFAQLEIALKGKGAHYSRRVSNEFAIDKEKAVRDDRIEFGTHFDSGGYVLKPVDKLTVENFIQQFKGQEVEKITVLGYTDDRQIRGRLQKLIGDNQKLSELRAGAVADYLKARMKLSESQIEAIGRGELDPIASNETPEGRTENRRVEIRMRTMSNEFTLVAKMVTPESPFEAEQLQLNAKEMAEEKKATKPQELPEGILSLQEGEVVPVPTASIRIHIDSRLQHKLYVDDVEIPESRIGFRKVDPASKKSLFTYFGVNMGAPGDHTLTVKGTDPFGNVRFNQSIRYHRSGEVKEIHFINADGNIADGKTPVTAKIAMFDSEGKRINAAIDLKVLSGKLEPWVEDNENTLPQLADSHQLVTMDREGLLKFRPVNKAGLYRMKLEYNGIESSFGVYVTPQYRDWVLVGIAEGMMGYNDVSGNMQALEKSDVEEDYYQDGRLAFYAKGRVQGKYLLTVAFDSSRKKPDERMLQLINPDEYYTLYGDHTEQQFDAPTRDKLFVRFEGDKFYAMFGDYDTELTVTELGRYSRTFTGAKGVYEDDRFSVNAFAANTDQMFARDEILGDGTSGLYRLSNGNIVVNSEKVRIEVRDRLHSERILSEKQLVRFVDYNLDFNDGTIYFKQPVSRHDGSFNPVYIVVDYEAVSVRNDDVIAGGRAAVRLADDQVELGITHIDEGIKGFEGRLTGVDARYDITEQVQVRAEVASSSQENTGVTTTASAYIAELNYKGDTFDTTVYARETETGFGIGQQNASEEGMRKMGAKGTQALAEDLELTGELSREERELADTARDVLTSRLTYSPDPWKFDVGATIAEDEDNLGDSYRSETLSTGVSRFLLDDKLRLYGRSEWVINRSEANNVDYPERHIVGADYIITEAIALFSEYERANTDAYRAESMRAGIKSTPWTNASMSNSIQQDQGENDERVFSVFGLTQSVPISEHWKASFSFDETRTIRHTFYTRVNDTIPTSSGAAGASFSTNGAIDEDFWATTAGVGYDSELYLFDTRLEYRNAETQEKSGIIATWQRTLQEGIGHALRLKAFDTNNDLTNDELDTELRYSMVFRPLGSEWFIFNRSELKYLKVDGTAASSSTSQVEKLVEHIALNHVPSLDWQAAYHFGYKLTRTDAAGQSFTTDTWMIGAEVRHDINELWDIGGHYHIITTPDLGLTRDSYGFSFGVDLKKNLWLSVGYNFEGYNDDDFDANGYTANGLFLKLRYKFDQDTFKLNE